MTAFWRGDFALIDDFLGAGASSDYSDYYDDSCWTTFLVCLTWAFKAGDAAFLAKALALGVGLTYSDDYSSDYSTTFFLAATALTAGDLALAAFFGTYSDSY